ncbi:hypothetical protein EJB05_53894, partial [Eragrostis curvula]
MASRSRQPAAPRRATLALARDVAAELTHHAPPPSCPTERRGQRRKRGEGKDETSKPAIAVTMARKARAHAHACAPPAPSLITFVVVVFLLLGAVPATAAATVPVHVGVILDLATELGKKSLLSLEMALEDFYAAHPNFTTRLSLRVRDSERDVVTAASAGTVLARQSAAFP